MTGRSETTNDAAAEPASDDLLQAVQRELTAFGEQVAGELGRLAEQVRAEQSARRRLDEQVAALAAAVEKQVSMTALSSSPGEPGEPGSNRSVAELSMRMDRLIDDVHGSVSNAVKAAADEAARNVIVKVEALDTDVRSLDTDVRRFDEQAARLVQHVNAVTGELTQRLEVVEADASAQLEQRVAALTVRLDEVSASVTRQQGELGQMIGQRVNQSEDRINERMLATEERLVESLGTQLAEVEAYVGRVGAGLDDSVALLAERIAGLTKRMETLELGLEETQKVLGAVDSDGLDEMREQIQSAAGEAMLVRIELERFQKAVGEHQDRTDIRLTEAETALQDQTLDVETAVQLDRLEELERAMIALDPATLVRRDVPPPPASQPVAPPTQPDPGTAMPPPPAATGGAALPPPIAS